MICDARVLDVFVTKDSDGYEFDDEFVCPVWSVVPETITHLGNSIEVATIICAGATNPKSEWISPCTTESGERLQVGDLVRIGDAKSGYTDYLTVMEVRVCTHVRNGVYTGTFTTSNGAAGNGVTAMEFHDPLDTTPTAGFKTITSANQSGTQAGNNGNGSTVAAGTATKTPSQKPFVCYRLNRGVECTLPPLPYTHWALTKAQQLNHALANRHTIFRNNSSKVEEKLYYPLYKVKKWLTNNGEISISLDHGVKAMKWMKLVGYSCFNKRQVGFQHAHEMIADDWIAVHIDEVAGNVISNNATANGAFCVLHVGNSHDNKLGAAEYHDHDPNGLFTHHFENQQSIRKLNLKLRDRQGNAAHFGRIHLWFKICVQHG